MQNYQREFIEFSIRVGALQFGQFTLKSGRISPYFFNTGAFDKGADLIRLGTFYSAAIFHKKIDFDMLFGPAYKGIPLATAIAISMHHEYGRNVPIRFDRKEPKDHGEGGRMIGGPLSGRVLIVDDVISAGTSVNTSMKLISGTSAQACGVMISLDREERGRGGLSAAQEVEKKYQIPVMSIVGLQEILTYIKEDYRWRSEVAAIEAYLDQYGV